MMSNDEAKNYVEALEKLIDNMSKDENHAMNWADMYQVAATILMGHTIAKEIREMSELH